MKLQLLVYFLAASGSPWQPLAAPSNPWQPLFAFYLWIQKLVDLVAFRFHFV